MEKKGLIKITLGYTVVRVMFVIDVKLLSRRWWLVREEPTFVLVANCVDWRNSAVNWFAKYYLLECLIEKVLEASNEK